MLPVIRSTSPMLEVMVDERFSATGSFAGEVSFVSTTSGAEVEADCCCAKSCGLMRRRPARTTNPVAKTNEPERFMTNLSCNSMENPFGVK